MIPNKINNLKPDPIASVTTNPEVPTLLSSCLAEGIQEVTCELYYALDWQYSFTTTFEMDCEVDEEDDFYNDGPCFAT